MPFEVFSFLFLFFYGGGVPMNYLCRPSEGYNVKLMITMNDAMELPDFSELPFICIYIYKIKENQMLHYMERPSTGLCNSLDGVYYFLFFCTLLSFLKATCHLNMHAFRALKYHKALYKCFKLFMLLYEM